MALWIQEWQVIHYCPSLSRMAKENIDQRKNCKKQGPDRASPCMPQQGNWNLSISLWEALRFWREIQGENRKVTLWSKMKKELGRIWKVTGQTEWQISRGLFFWPSWCPRFPPTASTPYPLIVLSDHHTGFHVERRLLIFFQWLQVTMKINCCTCKRRYKDTNFSHYKEFYNQL